jgi:hypothetical protein
MESEVADRGVRANTRGFVVRATHLLFSVVLALAFVLLLPEAIWLAFLAPKETIENYHFGAEAMVSHGGWYYRSLESYVGRGLALGLASLVASAVLAYAVFRPTRWVALGYLVFAVFLLQAVAR